jgi:hypothetical protein
MTLSDPIVVAFIRGLLTALGQAMFTGIVTYQATGSGEDAVLVGALTFLSALGIRGGVEGVYDQRRSKPEPASVEGFGEYMRISARSRAQTAQDDAPVAAQEGRHVLRTTITNSTDKDVVLNEPIELGQDYHYGPKDGKLHRGVSPTDCAVCIHDGFV